MRSMFILRRPGILVVSGIVAGIQDDNTVILENSFRYPISGQEEKTKCYLECNPDTIKRLHLEAGSYIIASATDDFLVEMLMEGGETPDREFHLKGYTVRYNGSFDFESHRNQKEQHVFSGTIIAARSGVKQGYTWSRATIGWKKSGKDEVRNIVFWSKEGKALSNFIGKRIIAVTGESRSNNGFTFYQATNIYDF